MPTAVALIVAAGLAGTAMIDNRRVPAHPTRRAGRGPPLHG